LFWPVGARGAVIFVIALVPLTGAFLACVTASHCCSPCSSLQPLSRHFQLAWLPWITELVPATLRGNISCATLPCELPLAGRSAGTSAMRTPTSGNSARASRTRYFRAVRGDEFVIHGSQAQLECRERGLSRRASEQQCEAVYAGRGTRRQRHKRMTKMKAPACSNRPEQNGG